MNLKTEVPAVGAYRSAKLWRHRKANGIPAFTPIEPAQQHLGWLWNLGFSDKALSAEAGLGHNVIWHIRTGQRGQTKVQVARAARIQALTHIPTEKQAAFYVPALGARRRIQALQAIGYSTDDQADYLGIAQTGVSAYMSQQRMYGRTWQRITAMYNDLSATSGPSKHAATLARGYGYAPPMAWEGMDIDHPDTAPDLGDNTDNSVDPVVIERILAGHYRGPVSKPEMEVIYDHAFKRGWTIDDLAAAMPVHRSTAARHLQARKARREAA